MVDFKKKLKEMLIDQPPVPCDACSRAAGANQMVMHTPPVCTEPPVAPSLDDIPDPRGATDLWKITDEKTSFNVTVEHPQHGGVKIAGPGAAGFVAQLVTLGVIE